MNTTALLPILPLLLLLVAACPGEDIYVSQGGGGDGSGSASARSMSWLNTAGNWGAGAGKVGPGDTVHLCGTLTAPLAVQAAGIAGNPITILFEPAAKFSAPTWATDVITVIGVGYIIVDGGSNGIIEATDNGALLTYQNSMSGLNISGSPHSEFRNLTIRNLYVRPQGSSDQGGGNGITIDLATSGTPSSYTSVHDNTIQWAGNGIFWAFDSGTTASIHANTIRFISTGIIFGSKNASATFSGVDIRDNDIADGYPWDDPADNFHHDGIHVWGYGPDITGLSIHGNYIHGNWGTNVTAQLYFEGTATGYLVYNNVLATSFRHIYTKLAGPGRMYNNTISGSGFALDSLTGDSVDFRNNILYQTDGMAFNGSSGNNPGVTSQNNLTANPLFIDPAGGDFRLQAGSPASDAGADLSAYFTTDRAGIARPQGSGWDIGAHEYQPAGENIYVSQAGGGSGASSASPLAMSWLATAGNWGAGAGKVGPGDTVHLCGTLTSTLTVLGSGSAGSPITIRFEPGAKLSKPAWGIDGASAVSASGKSHVVIDGAGVGVIECTGNGDALGQAQPAYGITVANGSDWTIRDLTIRNIFVHTWNATNVVASYSTRGVYASNVSDFTLSGNAINGAYVGLYYLANEAALTNCTVSGNTITNCSTALIPALGGSATDAMSGVVIAGNDIAMGLNWYDPPDANHIDGIHVWTSPGTINGLDIHGNYIHGDPSGHCTGYIFVEGRYGTPLFYNNLLVGSANHPMGGYFALSFDAATTAFRVFNNTVVGLASNNTGGTGISIGAAAGTVASLKNNILTNLYVGVDGRDAPAGVYDSDYNDIFGNGMVGWLASGSRSTLADWRTATGGDAHSISGDPALTGTFALSAGSPARDAGTALTAYFTTDKAGLVRPQGSGWDIGAFEYASGGLPTVAFAASVSSAGEGTASVNLPVTLSAASAQSVTVAYAVTGGTATGGGTDYTLASGTLTFSPGTATRNIPIVVVNDSNDEPDETIVVTLSGPTNATLGSTTSHTCTIIDNDPAPSVSLSASAGAITEHGGTRTVTATLSAVSGRTVTVNLACAGTAAAGDFTAGTTITIPAGSGSGTATVTAVDDAVDELDETVVVSIASATNASAGGSAVTVTIADDDPAPTFAAPPFAPASGAVGTVVVITGAGFTGVTAVSFNGTDAVFTIDSPTRITVIVPSGATSGAVTLTTPGGTVATAMSFIVSGSGGGGHSSGSGGSGGGGGCGFGGAGILLLLAMALRRSSRPEGVRTRN